MTSSGSTEVEHSTRQAKVKGLSPIAAAKVSEKGKKEFMSEPSLKSITKSNICCFAVKNNVTFFKLKNSELQQCSDTPPRHE